MRVTGFEGLLLNLNPSNGDKMAIVKIDTNNYENIQFIIHGIYKHHPIT